MGIPRLCTVDLAPVEEIRQKVAESPDNGTLLYELGVRWVVPFRLAVPVLLSGWLCYLFGLLWFWPMPYAYRSAPPPSFALVELRGNEMDRHLTRYMYIFTHIHISV